MKKIISLLCLTLIMGVSSASAQCCSGKPSKEVKTTSCCDAKKSSEVKAYYFHATRRCATCQAVEAVTKEALKEYYGDKITFESINREKQKDHALIEKHNINGQTLLIVKGDKVVDLTNYGFMNARTKPEKFKAKLKSTIDSLI